LAVSLHEELKNAVKLFSKTRPENLNKSQKKIGRYALFFLFFLSKCPLLGLGPGPWTLEVFVALALALWLCALALISVV
jgi:hypothetical protein